MLSTKRVIALAGVAAILVCGVGLSLAGEEKVEVVKRGEALGDSPEVSLATVMKDPDKYLGKTVILTAVAAEICQKKGCWMQVVNKGSDAGIRMTFKDYGFFMPKDGGGMTVRAEGVLEMKVLDKDHAAHLVEEGARIKLNEDGTANELGFVASGVELSGEKKAVKKEKKTRKKEKKAKEEKEEEVEDEDEVEEEEEDKEEEEDEEEDE
jgi:hypothetical protein